ncbi:PREDICTED: abscisic acid 8'-hydroxylase 1-like [Nicotiana attenuata]|uniref:Abscisic acid 8'-hydroxylase 1 n=1 Tax=Nicotiana attenuata TaxID=49451 RepID=A0A314LEJ0_NICAT|nr:PREDICTED: abscisic acid 8'-hydroxylase 1-like [Nicotiana attenuata]OIT39469.1 abscisic acid 8'-hydroxylase 1 [Nicotiana attenuata]
MLTLSMEDILLLVRNYYDILLASILVISIILYKVSGRTKDAKSCIPGSLGIPFVGETFALLSATNSVKGCYDFVRLRREWHGKWFKTRVFGKIHVFVPTVEGAKTIFTNDFTLFNKGYVKSMADAVGRKSLLCVPQESHKRIRRLLSDPFSMKSLSKFVQRFDNLLCERLKKVQKEGKSFIVLDFNMKITFDAMCDMLMSIKDALLLEQIERDCTAVSDAMLSFPVMIPTTRYYKGIKARTRLMETFSAMITNRRIGKEYHEDFLQSMLEKDSCPVNQKLDDEEIMDNLLTLIIAGQTTTAAAMMWSVKFLHEHEEVQDTLREEQISIVRSKPNGALLTLDDLNSMSYASKVVKETLRMSNVLLWFPRVALDDCNIEGFEIKKGWHANIDATCIHYDPALYKDPMQFNPSRFDEMQKPYSYIPFGSGPRTCLGINMAKVTMLVFLHRLTSGYKWTVDDLDPSLERKAHIPRLRSGCPITLTVLQDE